MKTIVIFTLILVILTDDLVSASGLQCYQCDQVTEPCEDNKASVIICGDSATSRCSRQVKKDSPNSIRAIRKCVIPDTSGQVYCPEGSLCFNCATNLCNANPIVTSTTPKSTNSAHNRRYVWSSLVAVIFVAVYL